MSTSRRVRPSAWNEGPFTPLNPVMVDKKEQKVELYDHQGKPLVKDKRIGFRPPPSAPSDPPPQSHRKRVQQQGQKTRS